MDIFYLSCINMNYTHIQNQPYCVVELCIKSIHSFWHSVLLLIWHKNSHSYGRNGLFFLTLSHLWLAILETEVTRGPRTVVLNLGCTRESAWEPSKILMPGSHPRESCLISGNAGCTGRMWCAPRVENHRLEGSSHPVVLSPDCRWGSPGKLLHKNPAVPPS